ncbi:outer membrane beta-barrel protein [Helicobacter bizzozeronii]|uniref:OMP921 n=1 Tax=Helicobacter bizzozeronii TaxID=56877 RepID=A0A1M4NH02_HELBI|nr:outer membrane beta-barrel protein [Helicobacter bizzozeronii]SFZ71555.1 OMP921 [Helicobacter bizzozeronii]
MAIKKITFLACCLALCLNAHPYSYLNGPLLSVGMGVGLGSVLEGRGTISKPSNDIILQSHSLQLGLQIQGGDQKYFTPFIGVAYYGYFGYRYFYMDKFVRSLENAASMNRYSLGIGANLLINIYSKFRKDRRGRIKVYAYGLFGGLLGVVNIWSARFGGANPSYVRNNANIDAVFGISMRFDKFKWSLGIHMPLASQERLIRVPSDTGALKTLTILDNYKSTNLFMNFTKVF